MHIPRFKKFQFHKIAKDISSVVPMPNKPHWVGIIGSDKGSIMDINKKKIVRTIPKWSGNISKDGKYTLYAPSRSVAFSHLRNEFNLDYGQREIIECSFPAEMAQS